MQTLQHTQLTQMKVLIEQKLQQAIEVVEELRQMITDTIESCEWRSDEYLDSNIEQLEETELNVIIIKRKLDKIVEAL